MVPSQGLDRPQTGNLEMVLGLCPPSPLSPALVPDNCSHTSQETRAEGKEGPLGYGDFCDISSYPTSHEGCNPIISERGMSNFTHTKTPNKTKQKNPIHLVEIY